MSDWNFTEVFIAMLVAVKCRYHLINNVVYINKIHNNARVIDANRKIIRYIVAESCNGTIIVWTTPLSENVREAVDKHFRSSFRRIFKHQLLASTLRLTVRIVKNRLNR